MKAPVAKLKPDGEVGLVLWSAVETIGYTSLNEKGEMSLNRTYGCSVEEVEQFALDILKICAAHRAKLRTIHEELLPPWELFASEK